MGQKLADYLNGQIDNMVTDDTSRSDIISSIASAAGIESGTVNQILAADIDCPPLDRLEGFATALNVSMGAITSAAEEDGCSYEDERKRSMFGKFTTWLKRELGLTQRAIKDVEEWDGAASNYSSTEAYCNACLINANEGEPEDWAQTNCKLPIREEGDDTDTFVRQAVFAASGGRGITQVEKPADVSQDIWDREVQSAANMLVQAYSEMDQEAPESVVEIAERKRALSISQLWEIIYDSHLNKLYGWDYWPVDIFFDADNNPFIIVATGGKLFRHSIMIDGQDVTLGEAIPVMQEFIPTARTTTTIKRMKDGRYRWFSVSASSVLNRVGEIDSRDLFDAFVSHSDETGEYPIRQFYHAGEAFRTGQADFLARDENLYITSGLYDQTEIAKREVKARQKEPEYWGDSIGYLPRERELLEVSEGVTIPVYTRGINTEISTLPEHQAANLFTANTEVLGVERMSNKKRKLNKNQKEALIKLFGDDEEEADQWLAVNVEERNRTIEEGDLITRSDDSDSGSDPESQEQEQEIVNELTDEDVARALEQSEPVKQLMVTVETLANQMEESTKAGQERQTQLISSLQEITTRIEALETDDESKRREWLENQPRRFNNTVKHIIRPRVERADEDDTPESFAELAISNLENKGIPNY